MALALKTQPVPVQGFIPVSMLDWDGMLSAVVFLSGCNFECPYCHNGDLVKNPVSVSQVSWKEIESHLTSKKDWLDGVVITGGEPTIHKNIKTFIRQIRNLGMKIKIDTNGALPGALTELIEEELVDYVAMDIKATFEKYELATGSNVDTSKVRKSVAVLRKAGVDYEFRTTVVPGITEETDILEIAKFLAGSNAYYLQQFNGSQVLEPQAVIPLNGSKTKLKEIKRFPNDKIHELVGECNKFVKTKARLY